MSDRDIVRVGDVLEGVGARFGLAHAGRIGRLWRSWREVAGEAVASHAEPTSLRQGVLRIRADSPSWATEIGYLSEEIKAEVNAFLGDELVHEVRVWTGPGRVPAGEAGEAEAIRPRPPARPSPRHPAEAFERARGAWKRTLGKGR
jgi:predicted nucleic acid-binding Zn ribbon protein